MSIFYINTSLVATDIQVIKYNKYNIQTFIYNNNKSIVVIKDLI